MIQRVSLGVSKIDRSTVFYDNVLAPLGYERLTIDEEEVVCYGYPNELPGLILQTDTTGSVAKPSNGTVIYFRAPDKTAVDDFLSQAEDFGGLIDEEPEAKVLNTSIHYTAHIIDPDGYRVAATA